VAERDLGIRWLDDVLTSHEILAALNLVQRTAHAAATAASTGEAGMNA
jgi:hypothetical protein